MNLLEYDIIRDFYNSHANCWSSDLFSQMTTAFIDKFVTNAIRNMDSNSVVLNAGSGGKSYDIRAKQVHLDIAEKTLVDVENAFVGNIINMPFLDDSFDCVVCVGTVINYCEAEKAIKEISRISKNKALLILEYERSGSGLVVDDLRNSDSLLFSHLYFDEPHENLLYSDSYIQRILKDNGYIVKRSKKFNTTIPWMERFVSEETAHKMAVFEPLFRNIPIISGYSHNEIMVCQKAINEHSCNP